MFSYLVATFHAILISNITIAIAIVTLLTTILSYYIGRDNGIPPGPYGVPVLGYWPFLSSDICHHQLVDMKKKYGDVFSFRITGALYINLASFKAVREAHITKSDYFQERTTEFNMMGIIFENAVVFSNGEKWQTVRRFFMSQFRERGMTVFKENTAETMYETINILIDELRRNTDKHVDILKILTNKSNLIIRQTLFGPNTPVTEQDVRSIQGSYRKVMSLVHSTNMILIGKTAKYFIMPFLPNYRQGLKTHFKVKNFFLKLVDDHRRTFDGENERDIIDSFIKEKSIRQSKGDPTAEYFTDETLVANLLQFVGDGVVNVATFVTCFLKSLLDYPEEQEKIYKELVEVCGEDRNPGFEDKSKLTYTNAFILEAQRTANFIPIFPSLECARETTVAGYRIPKGAITLMNIYAIHNDPNVYEEPEKFNPSRFIAREGKPKPESPITFGVGKRVCLGEGFVMMQSFLFCTAIVKNFRISYSRPKSYYELAQSRILEITITPRK